MLILGACLGGCTPEASVGSVIAHLRFDEPVEPPSRRALRAAAVPPGVTRLEIAVLGPGEERLGATALVLDPGPGEERLTPEGGRWQIDEVPAGSDRALRAQALVGGGDLPSALAYEGRVDGIEIRPNEVTDVGEVRLSAVGVRQPELDFQPPQAPRALEVEPAPEGERLRVRWAPPLDEDVAGHLLVVASATSTRAPILERGEDPREGATLAPGLVVEERLPRAALTAEVGGLEDGRSVRVLLYAFDAGASGAPLNWSLPSESLGAPLDTLAPGSPGSLAAERVGPSELRVEFVAPGEDGSTGLPAFYEVRAAASEADLRTDAFAGAPALPAPPVASPGDRVRFSVMVGAGRDLGSVGVRAVDRAGNEGPIAVARVGAPELGAPEIRGTVPAVALAGLELRIDGVDLGATPGEVLWTETSTARALEVARWTPSAVVVALPSEVSTGFLQLARGEDGARSTFGPVGVLARSAAPVDNLSPFELLGGARRGDRRVYALHRERGQFGSPEHAIQHLVGSALSGSALVPLNLPRSSRVAGDHRASTDLFAFVSGGMATRMTTAVVRGSTATPDATRLDPGVLAGSPDGIGLFLLGGGNPDRPPAMLVFTQQGILRAARVSDLRLDPFDGFSAYTSTVVAYRSVTGARGADDSLLLGLEEVDAAGARLGLWRLPPGGGPSDLERQESPEPPRTGGGIAVRALPSAMSTTSGFVVVHEAVDPDGRARIAAGLAGDWGVRPFRLLLPDEGVAERLEDVGLLDTPAGLSLVIVTTLLDGSSGRLRWSEVRLEEGGGLSSGSSSVVIEVGDSDRRARVGCKPAPGPLCPLLWGAADSQQVLFERR